MSLEKSGGTNFELAGLQVVGGSLRRSLGLSHDVSTLVCEIPSAGLPKLAIPKPGDEMNVVSKGKNEGPASVLGDTSTAAKPNRETLNPVAAVRAAEVEGGKQWDVVAEQLLVESVTLGPDATFAAEGTYDQGVHGLELMTVTLVDIRRLWPTHSRALPQTSFNVQSGALGILPRSLLQINGKFVQPNLAQIVEYVCGFLIGPSRDTAGMKVVRTPKRWQGLKPQFEFNPGENPYTALTQILDEFPARLALHWDNTLGFYEVGEGSIGYDPASGWANKTPLPSDGIELFQVERGLGWSPGYLVAYGPPTIASVAVDCLEPVIFIDRSLSLQEQFPQLDFPGDSPDINREANLIPVNLYAGFKHLLQKDKIESTQTEIRRIQTTLAKGKFDGFGSAAAARRVLTQLQQSLQTLQSDAGTELTLTERRFLDRFVMRPPSNGDSRLISRETAAIIRRDAYKYWRIPGAETYNRHLLPVLPRAETASDGTRLPPLVQSYRWAVRSAPIGGSDANVTTLGDIGTRALQEGARAYHNLHLLRRAILQSIRGALTDEIARKMQFRAEVDGELTAADVLKSLAGPGRRDKKANQFGDAGPSELEVIVGKAIAENNARLGAAVKGSVVRLLNSQASIAAVKKAGFDPAVLLNGLIREGARHVNTEWQGEAAGFGNATAAYKQQLDLWLRNQQQSFTPNNRSEVFTADLAVQIVRLLLPVGGLLKQGKIKRSAVVTGDFAAAARVVQLVAEAAQRYTDFDDRTRVGEPQNEDDRGTREQRFVLSRHLVNLPRLDDPDFQLYNADLGIFYSPTPVGHADRLDVPGPEGASIVSRAVRAIFGTRMRPVAKTTVAAAETQAQSQRPSTGKTVWDDYARKLVESGAGDFPNGSVGSQRPAWCVLDTPQDIFPKQVLDLVDVKRDHLGHYHQAYVRPGFTSGETSTRTPQAINMDDLPLDQGAPVYDESLRLLITLPRKHGDTGPNNAGFLFNQSQAKVGERFFELEPERDGWVKRFLRPLRVNPNGRVSGVEIALQDDMCGFATTVSTGLPERPFLETGFRTRQRRRPKDKRERSKPPSEAGA